MDKNTGWVRHMRTAVSLILVGLYVLGLIAMMTFSFQTGLILWVISTLGGIGLLYWIHTVEKRQAAENADSAAQPDSEARPEAESSGPDEGE